MVFGADRSGPVIHRTPKELRTPSVVVSSAPQLTYRIPMPRFSPDREAYRRACDRRQEAIAAKVRGQIQERRRFVAARPDDGGKRNEKEGDELKQKKRVSKPEVRALALAESGLSCAEVAAKYGIPLQPLYGWRHDARKRK